MIDSKMEPYYDIIINIFIGIVIIIFLHTLFNLPRIIIVYDSKKQKHNICQKI